MTNDQLAAVLDWQYPSIGKCYTVQNGTLLFYLWQDRATGQPSQTPQPTLAECEAWLPSCPPSAERADVKGLRAWLRQNMTQARRNLVRSLYCEFMEDLNARDWAAFEAGCNYVRAHTDTTQLPAAAWSAFKNACTTYNLPVTLT